MAEALKTFFSGALVRRLARDIARVHPGFPVRAFTNGKSRFTFTGSLDLRLQKGFAIGAGRVDAILDVYNLLTRDHPVEEDVATGPNYRVTTAIQPPRSVHVGARLTF